MTGVLTSLIRQVLIVQPEDTTRQLDYDALQNKGFPPFKIKDAIVKDPQDPLDLETGCPVFRVQAAPIKGGVILSLCLHHTLADGPMFSDVIEAIITNLDPGKQSFCPEVQFRLHFDEFEATLKPGKPADLIKLCPDRLWRDDMDRILKVAAPKRVTCKVFQYDMSDLLRIRSLLVNAMANARDTGPPASTNDCIGAFIWAHVVKAQLVNLPLDQQPQKSRLFIPVDFRQRTTPTIPADYFGNAIITVPVTMEVATLKAACNASSTYKGKIALSKAALAIRKTSDDVNEEYIRRRLNLAISVSDVRSIRLNVNAGGTMDVVYNNVAALDGGLSKGVFGVDADTPRFLRPLVTEIPPSTCMMLPRLNALAELALALDEDDMRELVKIKSWMSIVKAVVE